jgi:hypothetical protein
VLDRQAESVLAAAVVRHSAGRLSHYEHALNAAADIAGLSRDELAAALLATILGDDGSVPVDSASSRSRDHTARSESRQHVGAPHGRGDARDHRGGRDDSDRRLRQHSDNRSARPNRSQSERSWTKRESSADDGGRRQWDGSRSDRTTDVARADRPRKSKPPRWDATRRAERNSGSDARSTGSYNSPRAGARSDQRTSTWGSRDGSGRAAGRPDRQGPSWKPQTGQRRGHRSVA